MGVRLRVHDGEPIGQALRRFNKLLSQRGVLWAIRESQAPFVPATDERRNKRFRKRLKARLATLHAQQTGTQPVASLAEATQAFQQRRGNP